MADVTYIYENLLPERTPVAVNDFIRVIGSDNASYKALVSNLAKCIVENYAGSSLAGADKSIQNAINEISTKVDLADGGFAIAASSSAMTNYDLIYVYTGNETGYTYGNWYFWNGSAWTSGGEVGSIVPDASLSQEGRAADAKAVGDTLAEKADKDGVIATAEGLIGGAYTTEKEPYHFRKTAVDLAGRLDETIVGGSLGWNQLVDPYTAGTTTNNGITFTYDGNGNTTLSGSLTAHWAYGGVEKTRFSFVQGHKYYLRGCPQGGSESTFRIWVASDTAFPSGHRLFDAGTGIIKDALANESDVTANIMLSANYSGDITKLVFTPQLFDLTACFGSTIADYIYSLETANAGAGVAWVKRYIDLDTYHEYCEPTLKSVEGLVSHDVVGFNQFDKSRSQSNKTIDANGNVVTGPYHASDYIKVIPDAVYYAQNIVKGNEARPVCAYDASKAFIKVINTQFPQGTTNYNSNKGYVTMPSNARYVRVLTSSPDECCINLSDPSRNGTYEPYEKHSYPLDSSVTLRGVPKLVTDHIEFDGDKHESSGKCTTRCAEKVYDGSSDENWQLQSINSHGIANFYTYVTYLSSNSSAICNRFTQQTTAIADTTTEGFILSAGSTFFIRISSSKASTVEEFKAWLALNTVQLVHFLATPTTETAQPFQSPMIVGATEEYVSDSVVPVGHESKYYEDVAKKVNGLPKDFSTLIAPTEATFTATRNYSVGNYLIVKNQLYKVTSAISSGGTITPNSNCTATTIMAEILALA